MSTENPSFNSSSDYSLAAIRRVVVATGNAHKVEEIRAILAEVLPEAEFVALGQLGSFPEPEENGTTFYENALIKARAGQDACGELVVIADDSGICVDALDGAPGIYSARWAGKHGNDAANNEKLLKQMHDKHSPKERAAHFYCSIVMLYGDEIIAAKGICPGHLAKEARGEHGFGYDPLFIPDEADGRSMAELSPREKNSLSHRSKALHHLVELLRSREGSREVRS